MGKIKVLDKLIANMIAAGEVVERPSSVVKELVENAVDAYAGRITIEIKDGGKELIKITDDGTGMDRNDAEMCVIRHATSKISSADDLFDIKTMGFRGEALASICAVAAVTITTRKEDTDIGTKISIKGGEVLSVSDAGCPKGTTITVENLFFNTPARLSFLKKSATEGAYIEELIGKLILANPDISIRFIKDGKEVFYSKGDGDLKGAIYCVYGAEIAKNIIKVENTHNGITISGYAGNPNIAKPSLKFQSFFVNSRVCRTKTMTSALEFAYFQKMAQGKHPFCVLNIKINNNLCDVNVHPQKAEVKFSNDTEVYNAILSSVRTALDNELFIKNSQPVSEKKSYPEYKHEENPNISQGTFTPEPKPEEKKEERTFGTFMRKNTPDLPFNKIPDRLFLKEDKTEESVILKKKPEEIVKKEEPAIIKKEPEIFSFEKTTEEKVEEKAERKETPSVIKEALKTEKKDEKPEITYEASDDYKIIGQIFSTYIIIEKNNQMILLDQHAAHERMNYEMLRESYKNLASSAQYLMIPKKLELSASEYELIKENQEIFFNLGIEVEDFGGRTILIRSIPLDVKENKIEKLVYEIIDEISKKGSMEKEDFNQRLLYLVACKMSIKANMTLSQNEMQKLTEKAFLLNGKTTCPHGRPLFVSFDKTTIENKFER